MSGTACAWDIAGVWGALRVPILGMEAMTMRWMMLGVVVAVLSFLAGCGENAQDYAAREIERRAPQIIGPADSYQATVQGVNDTQAQQVVLVGRNVRPQPNLTIETLTLTLRDVRYQQNPFRVQSVGSSLFSARITDQAVNTYLRAVGRTGRAGSAVRDIQVSFTPSGVNATANYYAGAVVTPVTTFGTLEPVAGRVNYLPQRLTVAGGALPTDILQQIATQVNPVIDFTGLRFTPNIQRTTITQGAVIIDGTASLGNLP